MAPSAVQPFAANSPLPPLPNGSRSIQGGAVVNTGHDDLITGCNFNSYGNRALTMSSDARLKVWDVLPGNGGWSLVDTWRAHDAEITCASWIRPSFGNAIGSCGEDGKLAIWVEDPLEPPQSGRRFRSVWSVLSHTRVPFVSIDFAYHNLSDVYVGVISRDGFLCVYECADPESLKTWSPLDQFTVIAPNSIDSGTETSFKLCFDPSDHGPGAAAIRVGVERSCLSLAVAAMENVSIYRSTTGSNGERELHSVLTMSPNPHRGLVRDIAWAPRNGRSFDLIATACRDGKVRIFKVDPPSSAPESAPVTNQPKPLLQKTGGISDLLSSSSNAPRLQANPAALPPGVVLLTSTLIATLTPSDEENEDNAETAASGDVTVVRWDDSGVTLVSTGADGMVRLWKESFNSRWKIAAEMGVDSRRR